MFAVTIERVYLVMMMMMIMMMMMVVVMMMMMMMMQVIFQGTKVLKRTCKSMASRCTAKEDIQSKTSSCLLKTRTIS